MALSTLAAVSTILTNASRALDSVREQAKSSKDIELKENISKLYDSFLDMKELITRLTDENRKLHQAQNESQHLRHREPWAKLFIFS